jgi:hypothetical protein
MTAAVTPIAIPAIEPEDKPDFGLVGVAGVGVDVVVVEGELRVVVAIFKNWGLV